MAGYSGTELNERLRYRRAVEAALWGSQLVNVDAMRQAYFRDVQASYNDIMFFSAPADWRYQTTTPNNSTNYVQFFVNTADGPVVVEVPPVGAAGLFGSLVDAWNHALIDVGDAGFDEGHGGRYLVLPPGYDGPVADGYIAVPAATFNVYALLRVIPKSGGAEDIAAAIDYLKQLRIHPLGAEATPRFIDISGTTFDGVPAYDASYYTSLARMVAEEPVAERDLTTMGQLHSIGIGKDTPFQPDSASQAMFAEAITEAHAWMVDGFRNAGFAWWPDRQWRFLVDEEFLNVPGHDYAVAGRVLYDIRAINGYAVFAPTNGAPPNLYIKTHVDASGELLDGSANYRLRVPPNVPTGQFWSVVAYDSDTAAFIRDAEVVGVDSYRELRANDDGSIDLHFGPASPPGAESNWIDTTNARNFFLLFRLYAAPPEVLQRSSPWTLDDVRRAK